jgi:hypothetical protein
LQNHEKKKIEKIINPRFYGQFNKLFLAPYPSAFGQFKPQGCILEILKNYRKNEFTTYLNKNSRLAHTELEFDVLDVIGKLVKYVVHLSKTRN